MKGAQNDAHWNCIVPPQKAFDTKFGPQWKDWESSNQVRQILPLFCKLVALILSQKLYFKSKTVSKALELPKLSNKTNLKVSGASKNQEIVSRDNHLQNILDKLLDRL